MTGRATLTALPPPACRHGALLAVALAAGALFLSLDQDMYWHEIRFLYGAVEFSPAAMVGGEFNPHQFPGPSDALSAGGFYLAKYLHLRVLAAVFRVIPPAQGGLTVAVALYYGFLGMAVLAGYWIYRRVHAHRTTALACVCGLILLPCTGYLGGKLMAEVLALPLMGFAVLAFLLSSQGGLARGACWAVLSALCVLLGAMARLDSLLIAWGFWAAGIILPPRRVTRARWALGGVIVAVCFVVAYGWVIRALGSGPEALVAYLRSFVGAGRKPVAMSLLGMATFGGLTYCLGLWALVSRPSRTEVFFCLWLLAAAGPAVIITWYYMVEPRYLVSGLYPLGGLVGWGVLRLWTQLARFRPGEALVWVVSGVLLVAAGATMRFMPGELDRRALLGAVDAIKERHGNAAILVPWAYTDFHFLRLMRPGDEILNVNSAIAAGKPLPVDAVWERKFRDWYGASYVQAAADVTARMALGPVYYLGWHKYPPAERAKRVAGLFGLNGLGGLVDSLPLQDHLQESWLWHAGDFDFRFAGRCGQYEYYRVARR